MGRILFGLDCSKCGHQAVCSNKGYAEGMEQFLGTVIVAASPEDGKIVTSADKITEAFGLGNRNSKYNMVDCIKSKTGLSVRLSCEHFIPKEKDW